MGLIFSCCLKNDENSEEQDPLLQQQKLLQLRQDQEFLQQEEQRKFMEQEEQKILKRENELTEIVNNTNDSFVDISMINNCTSTMNETVTGPTARLLEGNSNENQVNTIDTNSQTISRKDSVLSPQSTAATSTDTANNKSKKGQFTYNQLDVKSHLPNEKREALVRAWDAVIGGYSSQILQLPQTSNFGPLIEDL
ncbi:hypothetical protein ACO0RG_001920 [Hanseniaspora osmophila]